MRGIGSTPTGGDFPFLSHKSVLKNYLYNFHNLDCFSSSELDSELDEGDNTTINYEHGYKTLI